MVCRELDKVSSFMLLIRVTLIEEYVTAFFPPFQYPLDVLPNIA